MEHIAKCTRPFYAALFVLAAFFAFAAQPATAAGAGSKGCWYEVGNPPACDICGWDCADGQQCCGISGVEVE